MSSRKLPMSERLFADQSNGGPLPRHLKRMMKELYDKAHTIMPTFSDESQYTLATHLKQNFSNEEIDWAHAKAVEFYNSLGKNREYSGRYSSPTRRSVKTYTSNYTQDTYVQDVGTKDADNQNSSNQDKNSDDKYVLKSDYNKDIRQTGEVLHQLNTRIDGNNQKITDVETHLLHKYSDLHKDVIDLRNQKPTVVEIKVSETKETQFSGIVHKQFPLLAKAAGARLPDNTRLNIWLYGPAGTGKTHAAKTLAQSLFGGKYRETNSETMAEFAKEFKRDWSDYNYSPTLSTSFQVMGYMDAMGKYVPTPFYLTWKYGGVFLLDEIDGSMQEALLGLNGALSSTYASFPCGIVPRHPDCIILAGANTTGHGGDIEYLGTMKQNVAFLDRWTFIEWPHDDALENSLVSNSHWVQRVRNVRHKLAEKKVKGHVVTMRASMQGAALLEAGLPFEQVEQMVLRKGIPQGTWELIK